MMPKILEIAVDLDAIVIDLLRPWFEWYNTKFNDDVTIDDFVHYKVNTIMKKARPKELYGFFENLDNYANCPVLPGAAETLRELHLDGHDIIIATATAGRTAELKWHHAKKVAPWLHKDNVMVGGRKDRVYADVFIDDAPENITSYRTRWPNAHILTIAYPYNKSNQTQVNCYAQNHNDTTQAWAQMYDYIRALAER